MKITSVLAQWLRIPLPRPVGFSIKTLRHRDYLLVRVRSDEGIEGVGVTLNDASAAPAQAVVADLLGPLLLGEDPRDISALWERLYWQTVRAGRRGSALFALSAVDIALWDHLGKLTGQPLAKLLGGFRDEVPCYASGGYYYEDGNDGLEQEIASYLSAGFSAVKMKIGRLSLSQEEERVRLVRAMIGPERQLYVDANQAWLDVNEAARFAAMCERYGVGWLEEPLPVDMLDGFRRLRARTTIPLATGEVEATRWAFHLLEGVDIYQHDATVCGGISEWLKITEACGARGISVAPHYFWDIHVHLAAARREVRWVEYFTGTDIVNLDLILQEPLRVTGGLMRVPDRPGIGMLLDEAAVQRYLYNEMEVKA